MPESHDMLRSVAAVLAMRGDLGPTERRLLDWLRERWDIAPAEAERLVAEGKRQENVVLPEPTTRSRREWVHALVSAIAIDGKVSQAEWSLLRTLAEKAGLRRNDVIALLEAELKTRRSNPAGEPAPPLATTVAAGSWPGPVLEETAAIADTEDAVPLEWNPGDVFLDRYEVVRLLGQGGVGKVFQVYHRPWRLDLAVKIPKPEFLQMEGAREHLVREAETWVNLPLHPHVAMCHYVRVLGGLPRIFAEFVDGGSLAEAIRWRTLYAGGPEAALARILDIAVQFAWGLDHAHRQGLVHGDVKPGNVLVGKDGRVKVTDFGLAQAVGGRESAAGSGAPAGEDAGGSWTGLTPAYCSPEQAESRPLTQATDVWSWAVSLLEMFHGEVVWHRGHQADDALQRYLQHGAMDHEVPPMPPALADLLFRCLRRDPAHRLGSLREASEELCEIHQRAVGRPLGRAEPRPALHLADGLSNRAVSLLDLGRAQEAEQLLRQALDVDPHHIYATYHLALESWRTGKRTDEAVVHLLREVQASQTRTWRDEVLIAWVHLERGDPQQAEADVREARALGLGDPEATEEISDLVDAGGAAFACRRALAGHEGVVRALALSADGAIAVSGDSLGRTRVWDVGTGLLRGAFEGHVGAVNDVAVTLDGRWAVTAGADGTLRLWDVAAGGCLRTMDSSPDPAWALEVTPDGRFAVAATVEGRLDVWDLPSGRRVRRGEMSAVPPTSLAVARDGRRAMVGGADGVVRVVDFLDGRMQQRLDGHARRVTAVAWTPDGATAVSGAEDRGVRVWDVAVGRCMRVLDGHVGAVTAVGISADGTRAISAGAGGTLRIWETATGRCRRTLRSEGGPASRVVLRPDGGLAVSADADRSMRVWELPERLPEAPPMIARPALAEELVQRWDEFDSARARTRAALDAGDVRTAVASLAEARAVPGFERAPEALALTAEAARRTARGAFAGAWGTDLLEGHTEEVLSLGLSRDGRTAVSGSADGTVRAWTLSGPANARVLGGDEGPVAAMALTPDGTIAVSAADPVAGGEARIRVWDVASGRSPGALPIGPEVVRALAMGLDGRRVAALTGDRLLVWDRSEGGKPRVLGPVDPASCALAFALDGRRLLAGLALWDAEEGRRLTELPDDRIPALAASVTPGADAAVTAHADGSVRLWDLGAASILVVLAGHRGAARGVAISSDGRHALSGGDDHALRLWHLESGECLRTLAGHTAPVSAVALTADVRRALSAARDETLRAWTLDWALLPRDPADWEEGAGPWVDEWLDERAAARTPGSLEIGPSDLAALHDRLARAGYGWLRSEGVEREVRRRLAARGAGDGGAGGAR